MLEVREVPEPHAGPGEVRVRVRSVGLNPMDGAFSLQPQMAAQFGLSLPSGFGYDFAGVVDEAGSGAAGGVGVFAVQLARLAGASVIGTASEATFEFVRQLGAEPVADLDRIQLAPC